MRVKKKPQKKKPARHEKKNQQIYNNVKYIWKLNTPQSQDYFTAN